MCSLIASMECISNFGSSFRQFFIAIAIRYQIHLTAMHGTFRKGVERIGVNNTHFHSMLVAAADRRFNADSPRCVEFQAVVIN